MDLRTLGRRLRLATAATLAAGTLAAQTTPTVSWVTWTDPGTYPSSAIDSYSNPYNYASSVSGTLLLPDNTTVNVTVAGETLEPDGSIYLRSAFGTNTNSFWNGGPPWQYPGTAFISDAVPTLPPNNDQLGQAGFANPTHTLTLSKKATSIVMIITSLGSGAQTGTWQFTQDFEILSYDPRDFATPLVRTTDCNGSVGTYCLSGDESSGVIRFKGSFDTLSWTVTQPEYSASYNIGVTSDGFAPSVECTGFFAPVDKSPVRNKAQAGRVIPLKWYCASEGVAVTTAPESFSVTSVACDADATVAGTDALEEYAPGSSSLINKGNGYWQFNWQTPKSYASACRKAIVSFDGATLEANFQFTR